MKRALRRTLGGVAIVAACAVLGTACGLRTPVRPPEDTAPVIPGEVQLAVGSDGVTVRWHRAEKSADGQGLDDLSAFAVERRRAGEEGWQRVAKVDVVDQDKIRRRKDFSWTDTAAGSPPPSYRVIAICADGEEGPPNEAVAATAGAAPSAH